MNGTDVGIRLEMVPVAASVPAGQEAAVMVILHNVGRYNVWANARMLLNSATAPRAFRELWIDVRAADGTVIPFTCKVKAGAAEASDYKVLRPGDKHEQIVKVSRCYKLSKPGTYFMRANYQDGNDVPAPEGTVHLTALLQSSPVRIDIH